MSKFLLSILLTLLNFSTFGQDYKIISPDSIKNKLEIDSLTIVKTYTLDDFNYYVGWFEDGNSENSGLKLYVFNPNGDLIFRSNSFMDSYTHDLTFFKSERQLEQTIILGHSSNEYSWGNEVYILKTGQLIYVGLLDVATFDLMDVAWDISKYTQIWSDSEELRFTFSYDTLIYNPGGKNEKVLSNGQIEYLYQKGQLKEKLNLLENPDSLKEK
jgi:hypothetical protein